MTRGRLNELIELRNLISELSSVLCGLKNDDSTLYVEVIERFDGSPMKSRACIDGALCEQVRDLLQAAYDRACKEFDEA